MMGFEMKDQKQEQISPRAFWLTGALAVVLLGASGAQAIGTPESIQPASLEVKARIQAIEQINVTAEKSIDETAPQASAEVQALLQELDELEALDSED